MHIHVKEIKIDITSRAIIDGCNGYEDVCDLLCTLAEKFSNINDIDKRFFMRRLIEEMSENGRNMIEQLYSTIVWYDNKNVSK